MSLNALITGSEDLDEKISAEEFIKTLKKVDSTESKKPQSGESTASGSTDKMAACKCDDDKKKLIEKKASGSDLLLKMRSRFQHRATEPVFHTLANAEARYVRKTSLEQQQSGDGGSADNTVRLPQIETLSSERRTDSAPGNVSVSHNKYLKDS
ncbi:unnamed protein product [Cylicocyclus nassatus]|uniref:Uncharacterized protein n=1 Tax=Cylicocyclus nassatus TaxID=53992 RepID=A0AA36DP97_CYLNA|nr:unnamed protein product [Cylicocyclus nassatus]